MGNIKTSNKLQVTTTIGLMAEQKSEIERISLKRNMSQQQVMRMMIDLGIECHKDMEKLGLVAAVDFAYYVRQALRQKLDTVGKKQLSLI